MLEIQQRASGPGESDTGVTYRIFENFFKYISVFNLFLFNICLICQYDNLQSM